MKTDSSTTVVSGCQGRAHRLARAGVLRDLQRPSQVFSNLTPNWYASIMGTGIVAVAAVTLPWQPPGLHIGAVVIWALAAVLLVALTAATGIHWMRYSDVARHHLLNPVMAHFYGAPPMALLTVGAGTILLGRDVLGLRTAVDVDWILWSAGTVTGLAAATVVPYFMFTRHSIKPDSAFGGWLMPVVPPMVSASTGALLVPYAPAGQARLALLMACYAMFGLSLLASIVTITLIWYRLALYKTGDAAMVPTLWIVLGPLGQSIAAANLLGGVARQALPAPYSTALQAFGVVYGVPVWGFALLWGAIAGAITLRTAREHLAFSLTWWSFTFPVGTCVLGTSELALHTGSNLFHVAAVLFYLGLVAAWISVAFRTARGSLRGILFLGPTAPVPTSRVAAAADD
ncbi:C4-dicarboxylate transporter/malic acid transport protein [Kribbella orskensis]|uniref:C4-dicarboxylate transporter/malic acid transport protein n=1 Tax=Kribbella orskensis TaxID=2512216 RepID=A0ABY2BM83_9ACTN|nr:MULTISPECIES: TDT family transporter [Kribbella]TCN41648.1 C4-dicarboxylate transporter/malic acid transport protein [Kribbella sp. VKM Ac-2500]TCO25526.1 C4-dicarboxylate transporter/malic acid transport protein [Kribbella orskensis]